MRQFNGPATYVVGIWAAIAVLFHLYTSGFGFFEPLSQRAIHLGLFLPFAFLLFPATAKSPMDRPSLLDWVLAFLALLPNIYAYIEAQRINLRIENVDPLLLPEYIFGTLAILLVLEAVRRTVASALAIICLIVILYMFTTEYMPGVLYFRDLSYEQIVETLYLVGSQGIYGFVTGISATMVAVFVIFGAFVEGSGTGRLFTNLGMRVAGRSSGGPAKVAVISSGLMGTMSGSSSANVVTTGSFTIPMMKKLGYRPSFAGGVEAAASVGGQIMPPIMGAAAFIMAETTRTPYSTIVIAATLGSLCYFFLMLVSIHFEAGKNGLRGLAEDKLPSWREVLDDAHLLLPIVLLCVLLVSHYSPHFSAFWSIVALIPVSWLRRHTRITPRKLYGIVVSAAPSITVVALACTAANIVITGLTLTGLSVSLGSTIMAVSSGQLAIAGIMLMFCTIVMGMGVPTSAAYAITASIGAPILIGLGVPVISAHLFVIYFAVLADATPPVSIASFVAASIARAHPIGTGVQALKLASAGFIVGFSYLFSPALTMQAPWDEVLVSLAVMLLSLTAVAASFVGYFRGPIPLWARFPAFVFTIGILFSTHIGSMAKLPLLVVIVVVLSLFKRHQRKTQDDGRCMTMEDVELACAPSDTEIPTSSISAEPPFLAKPSSSRPPSRPHTPLRS